jgi:3',5'-cyclic-AMP phosphodiesterase
MKKVVAGIIAAILLCSCKYVMYHPDEVIPNEKHLNADNIRKLESLTSKNLFRFVLVGDTQRFYDELDDFIDHINSQNDIAFVLFNGDMVDFGLNREYNWIAARLTRLRMPYIVVMGNHDMLANGQLIFREMFGPENFTFEYSGSKFICANTNSREYGMDGSVPNISWLESELRDTAFRNIFILSHVPPYSVDFDRNLEPVFASIISSNPKTRLSMHGHEHHYRQLTPYADGLEYMITAAGDKRNYALITVAENQYSIEQKFY